MAPFVFPVAPAPAPVVAPGCGFNKCRPDGNPPGGGRSLWLKQKLKLILLGCGHFGSSPLSSEVSSVIFFSRPPALGGRCPLWLRWFCFRTIRQMVSPEPGPVEAILSTHILKTMYFVLFCLHIYRFQFKLMRRLIRTRRSKRQTLEKLSWLRNKNRTAHTYRDIPRTNTQSTTWWNKKKLNYTPKNYNKEVV